jgi:hypothetical protein
LAGGDKVIPETLGLVHQPDVVLDRDLLVGLGDLGALTQGCDERLIVGDSLVADLPDPVYPFAHLLFTSTAP